MKRGSTLIFQVATRCGICGFDWGTSQMVDNEFLRSRITASDPCINVAGKECQSENASGELSNHSSISVSSRCSQSSLLKLFIGM